MEQCIVCWSGGGILIQGGGEMSLLEERIRQVEGLGPDIRKLVEELVHAEVFQTWSSESQDFTDNLQGFPKQ